MKALQFIFGIGMLLTLSASAQVSVNVNIGTRPSWGPVITNEEYYYLPDVYSYYDIPHSQFIFLNNGVWIRSRSLPRRYRNYNLNSGYIVILHDYHGNSPYYNHKNHKVKYYKANNGNHKVKKERGNDDSDHNNRPEKKNRNENNKNKGKKGK
jgi:hypothetical protein